MSQDNENQQIVEETNQNQNDSFDGENDTSNNLSKLNLSNNLSKLNLSTTTTKPEKSQISPKAESTCGFKMEKPKMPKFKGDVREYSTFRADFKYTIEAKYSERDSITFLRKCLEGKPLELIKGIGSDYQAAWEYLDQYTATQGMYQIQ